MAQIIPFRGTLYDLSTIGSIRNVVAPPYDIIDVAGQQALHDRHPHNIIRLELGIDEPGDNATSNRYTRAAETLRAWLAHGALKRDAQPAVYYHTIDYASPSTDARAPKKTLRGFLTTTKLEPLDSGHIYPHENTRSAAKTDRLNLLKSCKANLSPIWLLYSDPHNTILGLLEKAVKGQPPRIDFEDDSGCRQRLWAVADSSILQQIVDIMASKPLFIADGHHRYETALNYQRFRRETDGPSGDLKPYDSVLMLLSPLEDPGLTVLPTHRVITTPLPSPGQIIARLADTFDLTEFSFTVSTKAAVRKQFLEAVRVNGRTAQTFGLAVKGDDRYWMLSLKAVHRPPADVSPRTKLDVSLLQQLVVSVLCPTQQEQEAIVYTKDDHEALDWAEEEGPGTAALLLNATKVSEVQAVATAGERMPHKSTYFYPKPLTGLVIHVME